jgi:hypothetical protein
MYVRTYPSYRNAALFNQSELENEREGLDWRGREGYDGRDWNMEDWRGKGEENMLVLA